MIERNDCMKKCSVIIVDDEKKYWVDDYNCLSKKVCQMRFDFKSKKDLIANFKKLIGQYEGYWYYLLDTNDKIVVSGAFDPEDIKIWKENL